MGKRRPVSRVKVRKGQRRRKSAAKKIEKLREFGKSPNKGGLPRTWSDKDIPRVAKQIEDLLVAVHDYTDVEIADFYGIGARTLDRYKVKYPELARAMLRGEKQRADVVERMLIQTAVGYRRKAIKIMQHEGTPLVVHYEEDVAPNVTAQIAYLKAKRRDEYGDNLKHTGDPKEPVYFIMDGRDVTHLEPKGKERGTADRGSDG